jgi:hypothetical protein
MIEVPALMANPEFRHGFFGRRGGWSSGLYESLNCGFGSNDDPATVARNRTHVATALGMVPQTLVTPHQTHSTDVVVLEEPPGDAPCADALVTDRTGLAIGVLTADCGRRGRSHRRRPCRLEGRARRHHRGNHRGDGAPGGGALANRRRRRPRDPARVL